jgi:hypothetical protein
MPHGGSRWWPGTRRPCARTCSAGCHRDAAAGLVADEAMDAAGNPGRISAPAREVAPRGATGTPLPDSSPTTRWMRPGTPGGSPPGRRGSHSAMGRWRAGCGEAPSRRGRGARGGQDAARTPAVGDRSPGRGARGRSAVRHPRAPRSSAQLLPAFVAAPGTALLPRGSAPSTQRRISAGGSSPTRRPCGGRTSPRPRPVANDAYRIPQRILRRDPRSTVRPDSRR